MHYGGKQNDFSSEGDDLINQEIDDEVADEENFDSGGNVSDFDDYGMEDQDQRVGGS